GRAQRAGERLELGLDDVVGVAAGDQPDVERDRGVVGDRLEDVTGERPGEVATDEVVLLPGGLPGVDEVGPPGQVDDRLGEGLVHRDPGVAEPRDAALVPERPAQRLTEGDGDVLDGVVDVDVRVAGRPDGEVDERVLAQGGEHVVVEGHRRRDVGPAGPVEVELDDDARLRRRALHTRGTRPWFGHSPSTSCRADRKAAISAAVPIDTRSHPGGPTTRMRTPRSSSPCHTLSRSWIGPKRTKFASESATVSPWPRSHSTVRSRSARSSATCAMSSPRWRSAAR